MALKGFVNTISGKTLCQGNVLIVFSYLDLEMIKLPHADPLIIKLWIRDVVVSTVLVNEESISDILFWEAF